MNQLHTRYEDKDQPSSFPFSGANGNLFPPVCLRGHWDPTMILTRTLPSTHVDLPMDFRPWTKICKEYVTSGPAIPAPITPSNMVFPSGGGFYPPGRYAQAIDVESELKAIDRPLDRWCTSKRYIVPQSSTMYDAKRTVPERTGPTSALVQELAMPRVLIKLGEYDCRAQQDAVNWDRSQLTFNNATRQDRMRVVPAVKGGASYTNGSVVGLTTSGVQAPH